jgi:hypothetical protein
MPLEIGLPTRVSTTRGVSDLPNFRKQPIVFWSFTFLILLGGCDRKPECDSFETRNAVLKAVSEDHNNALGKYAAAKSDNTSSDQKPLYVLDDKVITRSSSGDKRTLQCGGAISVTVGDTKATKEVEFTVQQASDGSTTVAVAPFTFEPSAP